MAAAETVWAARTLNTMALRDMIAKKCVYSICGIRIFLVDSLGGVVCCFCVECRVFDEMESIHHDNYNGETTDIYTI